MRKHGKVDISHASIQDSLEQVGVVVWNLSALGGGVADLACYWPRTGWTMIELKSDPTVSHRSRAKALTPDQENAHALAKVCVCYTLQDCFEAIGLPVRIVTGTPA